MTTPSSSLLAHAHLRVKGETARPLCASELCDAAVSWWVLPSVEVREAGGRPVLGHAVEEGAGDADEVPQVLDGARVCSLALRLHQRSGSVGGGGAEDGGEGEGEEGGGGGVEWLQLCGELLAGVSVSGAREQHVDDGVPQLALVALSVRADVEVSRGWRWSLVELLPDRAGVATAEQQPGASHSLGARVGGVGREVGRQAGEGLGAREGVVGGVFGSLVGNWGVGWEWGGGDVVLSLPRRVCGQVA